MRVFRHYLLEKGKENKNELGIMKNVIKDYYKNELIDIEKVNILKMNDPEIINDQYYKSDPFKNIKIYNKISKSAEYQRLISECSNTFYERINEEYHNKYIAGDKIDNIDLLRFKIQNNYYFSKKLILDDIDNLFLNIRKKFEIQVNNGTRATYKNKGRKSRKNNNNNKEMNSINLETSNSNNKSDNNSMIIEEEKSASNKEENEIDEYIIPIQNYKYKELYISYLNVIYIKFIKLIEDLNFNELIQADIQSMTLENKLPKSNSSLSSVPVRKGFEIITDYHHIKPNETEKILLTSITPKCEGGECCDHIDKLGPFSLDNSRWKCSCKDRANNIECNPNICKCDVNVCKNLSLYKKEFKQMDIDVEERYSWGIDLYTYRNLLYIFPENFDYDSQYFKDFIEKTLILVINKLGNNENQMINACKYIISKPANYSEIDFYLAKHLFNLINISKEYEQMFGKVYCKGIGIFCKKKEGIKQNELIAPYLGEIYSPYLWYEKQDLIKSKKLDKNLPDFYNIMLERMKNDPDGYNLIMIDPNSKGNFASRMSHSCVPNCNTVLMISNKRYNIGMYAMRDIACDEELTFDYNSITEDKKEYQMAICLCSSYLCRGHYLIYSNSMIFTQIINKFHTFLHRNSILLKASYMKDQPLQNNELSLLQKYSIGNSLLNNCPIWLQRWIAYTLFFIDLEKQLLPVMLYKSEERERDINNKTLLKKGKIKSKKDTKLTNKSNKNKAKGKNKDKEQSNSVKKKRSSSCKTYTINKYNFDSDFIWFKKSYQSKTRPNNTNEKEKEESNYDKIIKRPRTKPKLKKEKSKDKLNSNSKNVKNISIEEEKNEINDEEKMDQILKNMIKNNLDDLDFINFCNKQNFEGEELKLINIEDTPSFDYFSEKKLKIEKDFDQKLYESCKAQVNGVIDQRIQSLAITIDKIKHILNLIGAPNNLEPPLRFLEEKEKYETHWKPMKEYLRENFMKLKEKINSQNQNLNDKYQKIIMSLSPQIFVAGNINYKNLNIEAKNTLLDVAKILYEISSSEIEIKYLDHKALADILSLYANTKVLFTSNKNVNGSFYGENIQILKRDVDSSCVPNEYIYSPLDTIIAEGKKEYENNYIWGQLVGWYKQTVDKPNASLSSEKKGALCYPDIECFFWNESLNTNKIYNNSSESSNTNITNFESNYPCGGRNKLFEKIKDNISMSWPLGNSWSYKNRNRIYGTVQLDAVFYGDFNLNKIENYFSFVIDNFLAYENK